MFFKRHQLMKPTRSVLVVLAALTLSLVPATPSFGATIFVSESGLNSGATLGNPSILKDVTDPAFDLNIYIIPDPVADVGLTYLGLSLGVRLSTPGVARITGGAVPNYDILVAAAPGTDIDDRWDGASGGTVSTDEFLDNMSGVSILADGIKLTNVGPLPGLFDDGYDTVAGAFHFATVTIDPSVGTGTTDLFLEVGGSGIARTGDLPAPSPMAASITFGDAEPTPVLGNVKGATGTMFDARITVVPEPSTILLLNLSLLLLFRRNRDVAK